MDWFCFQGQLYMSLQHTFFYMLNLPSGNKLTFSEKKKKVCNLDEDMHCMFVLFSTVHMNSHTTFTVLKTDLVICSRKE